MLTWTTYVNSIANLMPVASTVNINFTTVVPNMIDDAEQRLYRELDLLNTVVQATTSLVTGTRTVALPSTAGTFEVVNEVYAITPATQTVPDLGTRNPLTLVSRPFLDFTYPSSNGSTLPAYFAMTTQSTIILGPWPDQAYTLEVSGTIRPLALSSSNVTSLLSVYFPDCFVAASMVFISGYMKNYGAAVDDPQQGVSWEMHLQKLLVSAQTEEARKKFTSQAWSSKQPTQLVQRD